MSRDKSVYSFCIYLARLFAFVAFLQDNAFHLETWKLYGEKIFAANGKIISWILLVRLLYSLSSCGRKVRTASLADVTFTLCSGFPLWCLLRLLLWCILQNNQHKRKVWSALVTKTTSFSSSSRPKDSNSPTTLGYMLSPADFKKRFFKEAPFSQARSTALRVLLGREVFNCSSFSLMSSSFSLRREYVNTQYNTSQHNISQHNTTHHHTTHHNTTHYNSTQHITTQHNTTQHNTTQHNTTQHNTTQHISSQLNTTQNNTSQHNTI